MSDFYRNNYVVRDEQVRRLIDANVIIDEKMRAILDEQRRERREKLMRERAEAGEGGDIDFKEGLFAEDLTPEEEEPEIDYVARAKEEADQILSEANGKAVMIHDQAVKDADTLKEIARQDGYNDGYESGMKEARAKLAEGEERLERERQDLQARYDDMLSRMEPELLDTILSVFENVFRMQFSAKREMLLSLVVNAMRGIRETRQYKIRVSESEVGFLREQKELLQEKVGEDVQIEIVMDPALRESQCVIDADSGVYDCSLDEELDNLVRDLRSLCSVSG